MKFWDANLEKNEIYIYGDIVSEQWFNEEVTARAFAEDLNSFSGEINIHINSNGGDIFAAMAIGNLISQYPDTVNVYIDGICASAATLIACSADYVYMAKNALLMTHAPEVGLNDFFSGKELEKVLESLKKIEQSILETYSARLKLTAEKSAALLSEEMWYTAEEAKAAGFIDEITEEIPLQVDDAKKIIFMNSMKIKNYKNAREKIRMDKQNLLQQIKNLLNKGSASRGADQNIRDQEMLRIRNLNALRGENAAVNAIIDTAIKKGSSIEDIQDYVEAVKDISVTDKTAKEILNLIEDNLKSGASGVNNFSLAEKEAKTQIDLIAKYANGGK